ncbi:MAG: hypothetical protein HDT29_05645 [Clostridiales bacterium]|nr:hypothetical protein [Clostridiales bacterium]
MATINYQFSDGHFEEIEVTEEFKREYEFLLIQERALHWKEMQQKYRAGMRCTKDFSLDKFTEDGYELPSAVPDPLEILIEREERREYYEKLLRPLTDKQREVYILHFIEGYSNLQIATLLHIDESSVRERIFWAQKKISKNF